MVFLASFFFLVTKGGEHFYISTNTLRNMSQDPLGWVSWCTSLQPVAAIAGAKLSIFQFKTFLKDTGSSEGLLLLPILRSKMKNRHVITNIMFENTRIISSSSSLVMHMSSSALACGAILVGLITTFSQ